MSDGVRPKASVCVPTATAIATHVKALVNMHLPVENAHVRKRATANHARVHHIARGIIMNASRGGGAYIRAGTGARLVSRIARSGGGGSGFRTRVRVARRTRCSGAISISIS